jgi:hypothetical protein
LKILRPFAALSVVRNIGRLILCGGVVTLFLVFGMSQEVYAEDNQEQVVVSPAQQAVNSALATATTEVQQAIAATDTATAVIAAAVVEKTQVQAAVDSVTVLVAVAQDKVDVAQSAIDIVTAIDTSTVQIKQDSPVIVDAQTSVINATNAINAIDTSTAQIQVTELIAAKAQADTATATAQTELTQANIAIDNAQTAVNNLQATIGTSTNVLAGVDDAGVRMNLPFDLLMGGTLYNNVYVGSNATVTFGVNEGSTYHTTPNAPSISIAGWDWTTWSTGTGITYATTGTSLDIAWDLRPYPQQDASTQMVQIRFNADVNPNDGAWIADVTATGPIPDQARFNVRETTNGALIPITDTNVGAGFAGQISQGAAFTPYVDPNTETVQAAVDAANATIAQLNSSLTPVVAQNTTNTTNKNNIGSTNFFTNTLTLAESTKTSLQSILDTKEAELNFAISLIPEVVVVPEPQPSPQPQPEPIFEGVPDFQPILVEPPVETVLDVPVEEEIQPIPELETVPEPEPEVDLEPVPVPELTLDDSLETSLEEQESILSDLMDNGELSESNAEAIVDLLMLDGEVTEAEATALIETFTDGGALTGAEEDLILDALSADGEITQTEVNNLSETLSEDGQFTEAERELVAEALIESAGEEAVTAEAIEEAGLTYEDLPAETPVEVRQDENGNEVIITAEVAAALTVLESPAEFIGAIFDDPGQALTAVLNIGADMSTEEREESEKIIVAAVIAGQAAINAATMAATGAATMAATGAATTAAVSAAGTATGGTTPTSGGGAGGPAAGNDKPKRTVRRRKP